MLIVFEGMDKVGKTSLISEFHKNTNYKYLVQDRGILSFRAYNELYNRNKNYDYKDEIDQFKKIDILTVYLRPPEELIKQRFIESNEPKLPVGTIHSNLNVFDKKYKEFELPKIKIDTSNSFDECIECIKTNIKRMTNEKIL